MAPYSLVNYTDPAGECVVSIRINMSERYNVTHLADYMAS